MGVKGWLTGAAVGLSSVELAADSVGWRGLTLLDTAWGARVAVLALAALTRIGSRRERGFAVGLAVGSIAHVVAAGWRRRGYTPLAFFEPVEHPHLRVTAVELSLPGGTMPGIWFAPADAERAVVLMPGAGSTKTSYTWPLIEGLVQAGCAVLTIDLDGHGNNTRTLDYPAVLDNPQAAVAFLRQYYAWVGLLGISMGGCVGARAVAEGLNVDGMVLLAAPITVAYTATVRRREYQTLLRPATWALHRHGGTLPLVQLWSTPGGERAIDVLTLIDRLDLQASVAALPCPVLLCYGGMDLIAPVAHALALKGVQPQAHLAIIPRATHLSVSLDQRAIRDIAAWLTGTP